MFEQVYRILSFGSEGFVLTGLDAKDLVLWSSSPSQTYVFRSVIPLTSLTLHVLKGRLGFDFFEGRGGLQGFAWVYRAL